MRVAAVVETLVFEVGMEFAHREHNATTIGRHACRRACENAQIRARRELACDEAAIAAASVRVPLKAAVHGTWLRAIR